jgi:hypothetical protein
MSAIPKAADFYNAVHSLKRLDRRHQALASYIAEFWSDDRLAEAEWTGDLPGQPGALGPARTEFH